MNIKQYVALFTFIAVPSLYIHNVVKSIVSQYHQVNTLPLQSAKQTPVASLNNTPFKCLWGCCIGLDIMIGAWGVLSSRRI